MMSSAAVLAKTFRATRKPFRARAKTVRLPVGITVRLQPGIPFAFTPESFSRSPRNPFRLRPESALTVQSPVIDSYVAHGQRKNLFSDSEPQNVTSGKSYPARRSLH